MDENSTFINTNEQNIAYNQPQTLAEQTILIYPKNTDGIIYHATSLNENEVNLSCNSFYTEKQTDLKNLLKQWNLEHLASHLIGKPLLFFEIMCYIILIMFYPFLF